MKNTKRMYKNDMSYFSKALLEAYTKLALAKNPELKEYTTNVDDKSNEEIVLEVNDINSDDKQQNKDIQNQKKNRIHIGAGQGVSYRYTDKKHLNNGGLL